MRDGGRRLYYSMKRRLLNLLTALSLLLCVAVVVLWVRSYLVADLITWRSGEPVGAQGWYDASSAGGGLRLQCQWHAFEGTPAPAGVRVEYQMQWPEGWWREDPAAVTGAAGSWWWGRRGFAFERTRQRRPASYGLVSVQRRLFVAAPHWLPAIAAALAPALWLARTVRKSRRSGNLCPTCAYDLRATPARCPECGAAASVSTLT
jgi:hypothetical protein